MVLCHNYLCFLSTIHVACERVHDRIFNFSLLTWHDILDNLGLLWETI